MILLGDWKMKKIVYFDMDGVLCDWVKGFESLSNIKVEDFNLMTKEKKDEIKQQYFTYDLFYNLEAFETTLEVAKLFKQTNIEFKLCTATGKINVDDIKRAKQDWVKKYLGDVEIVFVDKIENKYEAIAKDINFNDYDLVNLFDDRDKAVDAFNKKCEYAQGKAYKLLGD